MPRQVHPTVEAVRIRNYHQERKRAQVVKELAEANEVKVVETKAAEEAQQVVAMAEQVVEVLVQKEDGTIPLATIGPTERRLSPFLPEEMQIPSQEVANALNRRVATNEMPSRVHPSRTETAAATNRLIWRYWVEEERSIRGWASTSSATCNYVDFDVWGQWTKTSASTTTATYYARAWKNWTDDMDDYVHERPFRVRRVPPPPPTPEELARQQALRDAEEAARKARVAALEFAKEKSHKLLLSVLDPKQQEELKTKGHFHCKSKKGVLYRIYTGTHGNVKRLDDRGKEVESLCVQPDNVPVYDAMLAQKLHIELNEDEFRKAANITRVYN